MARDAYLKEMWTQEVLREPLTPPKIPSTLRKYNSLSEEARYRLQRCRVAYHGQLVLVQTPAMKKLHVQLEDLTDVNPTCPSGPGANVVIDGEPGLGKTTMITQFAKMHERRLRAAYPERFVEQEDHEYLPVVFITLQSGSRQPSILTRMAEYLNVPVASREEQAKTISKLVRTMLRCETELVIFDEVSFLNFKKDIGQVANDLFKHFANVVPATFVLTGADLAESSRIFAEGGSALVADDVTGSGLSGTMRTKPKQNAVRYSHTTVTRFGLDILSGRGSEASRNAQRAEWQRLVAAFEQSLALYHHDVGSLAEHHWRYLLERANGSMGSLAWLMRLGAVRAIKSGAERLDPELLDEVQIDFHATRQFHVRQAQRAGRKT